MGHGGALSAGHAHHIICLLRDSHILRLSGHVKSTCPSWKTAGRHMEFTSSGLKASFNGGILDIKPPLLAGFKKLSASTASQDLYFVQSSPMSIFIRRLSQSVNMGTITPPSSRDSSLGHDFSSDALSFGLLAATRRSPQPLDLQASFTISQPPQY